MIKKILFVSHCMMNISSKVISNKEISDDIGDKERKKYITHAINNDICIIQLPCPEFTLYGSRRWGHVKDQFDNPFYRQHCEKILEPIMLQLREYCNEADKFDVLGIVGIDGSPSCGVLRTCRAKGWYGEFSGHKNLASSLNTIYEARESGVMIDVLKDMLRAASIDIKIEGFGKLDTSNIYRLLDCSDGE